MQFVQGIEPSAALVQIHPLVPFTPFFKPSVHKAPQVVQISFNKMTVVVSPSQIREQNNMAAFMLRQATEQALITFLKIMTGLHLNTHSIDRLVRSCSMISNKTGCIVIRDNDRDERFFQLIQ